MRCCSSTAYDELFDAKMARRDARKYRRRGLGRAARRIVDSLGDVRGETVLEAGGGIGAIQLELLQRGAARTVNVELSHGYEEVAAELAGGDERIERRIGDFVTEEVEPADVVVLHRVVCCYPDPDALVGAAAAHARRAVALSCPPDVALARLFGRGINLFFRLRRSDFRFYVHPRDAIVGPALGRGFDLRDDTRAGVWRVLAFERTISA